MARRNRDIRQLFVVVVMWKVLWKKDMHRLPSKNLHYKTSAISLFIIRLPIAFIVSYLGKLRLYNKDHGPYIFFLYKRKTTGGFEICQKMTTWFIDSPQRAYSFLDCLRLLYGTDVSRTIQVFVERRLMCQYYINFQN